MNDALKTDPYMAVRQAFDVSWPGPRGPKIILSNDSVSVTVYPEDGCRITSLNAFGYELLRQWNPQRKAFQYGCFPMVPWVGRLGNATLVFEGESYALPMNKPPHALHGMSCFSAWQIIETSPTHAIFSMELDSPWPWKGSVTQTIKLDADTLIVSLIIYSNGDKFPAAAGWHPWFSKWIGNTEYVKKAPIGCADDELQVCFNADWQEEAGDNELLTGKRIAIQSGPWDDCFGFNGGMSASLCWPEKVCLDMSSEGNYMVVFNKQQDATCVEPLTGIPNGVNIRADYVTKDNPLEIMTKWVLHAYSDGK